MLMQASEAKWLASDRRRGGSTTSTVPTECSPSDPPWPLLTSVLAAPASVEGSATAVQPHMDKLNVSHSGTISCEIHATTSPASFTSPANGSSLVLSGQLSRHGGQPAPFPVANDDDVPHRDEAGSRETGDFLLQQTINPWISRDSLLALEDHQCSVLPTKSSRSKKVQLDSSSNGCILFPALCNRPTSKTEQASLHPGAGLCRGSSSGPKNAGTPKEAHHGSALSTETESLSRVSKRATVDTAKRAALCVASGGGPIKRVKCSPLGALDLLVTANNQALDSLPENARASSIGETANNVPNAAMVKMVTSQIPEASGRGTSTGERVKEPANHLQAHSHWKSNMRAMGAPFFCSKGKRPIRPRSPWAQAMVKDSIRFQAGQTLSMPGDSQSSSFPQPLSLLGKTKDNYSPGSKLSDSPVTAASQRLFSVNSPVDGDSRDEASTWDPKCKASKSGATSFNIQNASSSGAETAPVAEKALSDKSMVIRKGSQQVASTPDTLPSAAERAGNPSLEI